MLIDSQGFFTVVHHPGVIAFFGQVKGNQFCYIYIIIYDENFLF